MILGSYRFWQKTVKWYIIYRIAGFVGCIVFIPIWWASSTLWQHIELAALAVVFVLSLLAMFLIWLVDRLRYGF